VFTLCNTASLLCAAQLTDEHGEVCPAITTTASEKHVVFADVASLAAGITAAGVKLYTTLLRCCVLLQFTDEHGEVCPAGWTPGAATMKADPKGSLDYFAKLS
jgi:alkyl hydroperoxide reductase subunit AhpC